MKRALCLTGCLFAAQASAQAQRTITVRVTGVAGRDVFLDQGRDAGLRPGQRVRLLPVGAPGLDAVVRAVASRSANAELPPGMPAPPIGTIGEAEVNVAGNTDRPAPAPPPPPNGGRPVPEHPPWSRAEPARSADAPLLAPAFGRPAGESPTLWRGRVIGQLDWSRDRSGGRDSDYQLARLGIDADGRNVFGDGGLLRLALDVERRGTDLADDGEASNDRGRIERFSYRMGDQDYAPWRAEVGRFVSEYVPELGLLDGAEGVLRFSGNLDIGAGFGALPLPFPARTASEDFGAHVFAQVREDGDRPWSALAAVQKTWHRGAPDRDQFLGRAQLQATDDWWLWTSARVDLYSSSDERKASGPQLTEAWAQVRWQPRQQRHGAALMGSHYRWPDLKRREFANLPEPLVRDGHVERLGLSAWRDLTTSVRLDGRFDMFFDRNDEGLSGELRCDLNGVIEAQTQLGLAMFWSQGSYLSGPGLRVQARRPLGALDGGIGYEMLRWSQDNVGGDSYTATRQSLQIDLAWRRDALDLSLVGRTWFNDGEQAMSLDLLAQYRF